MQAQRKRGASQIKDWSSLEQFVELPRPIFILPLVMSGSSALWSIYVLLIEIQVHRKKLELTGVTRSDQAISSHLLCRRQLGAAYQAAQILSTFLSNRRLRYPGKVLQTSKTTRYSPLMSDEVLTTLPSQMEKLDDRFNTSAHKHKAVSRIGYKRLGKPATSIMGHA